MKNARGDHRSTVITYERHEWREQHTIGHQNRSADPRVIRIVDIEQNDAGCVPNAPYQARSNRAAPKSDRKSTRLNSSHEWISYAVFCLKKKKKNKHTDI